MRGWLVAGLLATQSCGDLTGAPSPGAIPAVVRGSVTSSKTSHGVPNLLIALLRDGRVLDVSVTDSAGAFRFAAAAAGSYTVRVSGMELAGLTPRLTTLEPEAFDLALASGETRDLFFAAVGLIPPRIVGIIRCNGLVQTGVRVRVIGGSTDVVVESNAQGKYAATDLEPGHYAVIPVSSPLPCALAPAYGTASLLAGQAATVDFSG